MDVANASMYDGSTAMAEAFLMAQRVTRKDKVVIAQTVHPEYLQVAKTYTQHGDLTVETVHFDAQTGRVLEDELNKLDDQTAAFVVQSPNFFGCVEDLEKLAEKAHAVGALFIVVVTEAISFGLLKSPGACGADIVVAEGQSFGIPMSFGGPHVGLFACSEKYVRQMPGQTRRSRLRQKRQTRFCFNSSHTRTTYSPRQSDIEHLHESRFDRARRDHLYGSDGQKRLAGSRRAKRAKSRLTRKNKSPQFPVLKFPFRRRPLTNSSFALRKMPMRFWKNCASKKTSSAVCRLSWHYDDFPNDFLVCVTETNTKEQIDNLVEGLKEIS